MKNVILILVCLCLLLGSGCGAVSTGAAAPASPAPTEAPAPEPSEAPAPAAEPEEPYDGFRFSATDRNGGLWDQNVFASHALTMINFWEPWCGPCVNEMPDLQRLSENYADRGLLILGVYSTAGMEKSVDNVLRQTGVTYPILNFCPEFQVFETGYVPTTVFVDREGNVLSANGGAPAYVGSRSYDDWAAIVEGLL